MLQKHFGDEPRSGTTDDVFMRQRILDQATEVGMGSLTNNDDVLLYLIKSGADPDTIIARKIGFVAGAWSLVESLPEGRHRGPGEVHRPGPPRRRPRQARTSSSATS
jgi:hypothetical protein